MIAQHRLNHARQLLLQVAACCVVGLDAWSPRPPIYQIKRGETVHKSLYPENGPIQVLIGDDHKLIENDQTATWIVEYYDVSCPHCWYFSAVYPTIAKAVASPTVKFGAFNCLDGANSPACQAAEVFKYPTILAYHAKLGQTQPHTIHIHTPDNPDDPLPAKEIAEDLVRYSGGKVQITNPQAFDASAQFKGNKLVKIDGPPGVPGWTHEAYGTVQTRFHDAHIGLGRLLIDGYVNKGKYQAALKVVEFVGRCFSKDEKAVFDNLLIKLRVQSDLEPAAFKSIMTTWMMPFTSKWLFCKTKTCGVWQLFHGISATIAIGYSPVNATEALPQYRYMVDNFLDCEVCKHHFVTSYDNCLFGRCEIATAGDANAQAKALVLFLWRLHNDVNVRVLKENPALSKGGSVDRRWPTFRDCEGCWKPAVVQGTTAPVQTFQGQQGHPTFQYAVYDEDQVFGFIKYCYLGIKEDRLLYQKTPRIASEQQSILTTSVTPIFATLSCAVFGLALVSVAVHRIRGQRTSSLQGLETPGHESPLVCDDNSEIE